MPIPTQDGLRLDVQRIQELLGDRLLAVKEFRGDTFLCVSPADLRQVIQALKNNEELDYSYFSECVGADYSTWTHARDFPEPKRFEVVYNLMSLRHMSRIFVKVTVNDGEKVPTIKDIFLGADYPEREIWDLFGVVFEGNEQKQRFLLPDDWVGFPLRKEYPLGGEDVVFDQGTLGPAVEDISMPLAGESFDGKTGSENVSGR